jgi:chorismate lyase/3-hydroxybenzoate synthase
MSRTVSNFSITRKKAKSRRADELNPPAWAQELVGEHFSLLSVRVTNAADLTPVQLEQETFAAYEQIAQQVAQTSNRNAVRFWNHVPSINDPADAGRDVYMVFNAGRFRAFSTLYGGTSQFDREIATASAIGHRGRDLVIHCLSTDVPGTAVNNPRQVAPYHYSQRFGPLPPCFSRATRLNHPADMLLVGGTASVRGEDSVHIDDLAAQCHETFLNLAVLVAAAENQTLSSRPKLSRWLGTFTELRVYFPNHADASAIEANVRVAFPRLKRLEMFQADLCRAELLVEIEGVADLKLLQ